jgi:BirA family biotin operon repressor/biotin-[acetyl-CoA-carboxylase] ligase
VRRLVEGPSVLSGLEWHDEVGSTSTLAAAAAARGVPEVHAVLADLQTAGRGRHGRPWTAPRGTSLLQSLVVRPAVRAPALGLLPLLAGLALAEAADPLCAGAQVSLKWPNDLLVNGRKAAGVLVEGLAGACVVGMGVNVDWRDVERPAGLAASTTSLAEEAGGPVDRWELFARLVDVFGTRYRAWTRDPAAFLDAYRRRCLTIGQRISVDAAGRPVRGIAAGVADDGALEVRTEAGVTLRLVAGDVAHVRPLDAGSGSEVSPGHCADGPGRAASRLGLVCGGRDE